MTTSDPDQRLSETAARALADAISVLRPLQQKDARDTLRDRWRLGQHAVPIADRAALSNDVVRRIGTALLTLADEWDAAEVREARECLIRHGADPDAAPARRVGDPPADGATTAPARHDWEATAAAYLRAAEAPGERADWLTAMAQAAATLAVAAAVAQRDRYAAQARDQYLEHIQQMSAANEALHEIGGRFDRIARTLVEQPSSKIRRGRGDSR